MLEIGTLAKAIKRSRLHHTVRLGAFTKHSRFSRLTPIEYYAPRAGGVPRSVRKNVRRARWRALTRIHTGSHAEVGLQLG
ncbi:hypothetical protein PMO31116_02089 [Pandoraea morbifera]|uniref:Uncharacterized protein n=1 Tax=Pandoraea morbifera TaxID=2508300 RepID=A0A5E4UKZ7_9BURK|nr:hypothetical protein PMO31116_02089 [Pandoraea morbifera]